MSWCRSVHKPIWKTLGTDLKHQGPLSMKKEKHTFETVNGLVWVSVAV